MNIGLGTDIPLRTGGMWVVYVASAGLS